MEEEVKRHKEALKQKQESEYAEAKKDNKLVICPICDYDEHPDTVEKDRVPCLQGHYACKRCVFSVAQQAIKQKKTNVQCPVSDCNQCYSVATLKKVLPAKTFSRFMEAFQNDEIDRAQLPNLEKCTNCPYAVQMEDPVDVNKIFVCLNPDCPVDEICRICKFEAHTPLHCSEVERDESVRKSDPLEEQKWELWNVCDWLKRRCLMWN